MSTGAPERVADLPAREREVCSVDPNGHHDRLGVVEHAELVADESVDGRHDATTKTRLLDRGPDAAGAEGADGPAADAQHPGDRSVQRGGHRVVHRLGQTTADHPGGTEGAGSHGAVDVAHGPDHQPVEVVQGECGDVGGSRGLDGHAYILPVSERDGNRSVRSS